MPTDLKYLRPLLHKQCITGLSVAISLVLLLQWPSVSADVLYGEPLSDAKPIRIAELTANPDAFVDKDVKVVGLAEDICPKKGCWVDIVEKQSVEKIRLKVEDDVIVFPVEAKGSEIVAEGVLRRIDLSPKRAAEWHKHQAEERGETYVVPENPKPLTIYQIEGRGAVVSKSEAEKNDS